MLAAAVHRVCLPIVFELLSILPKVVLYHSSILSVRETDDNIPEADIILVGRHATSDPDQKNVFDPRELCLCLLRSDSCRRIPLPPCREARNNDVVFANTTECEIAIIRKLLVVVLILV